MRLLPLLTLAAAAAVAPSAAAAPRFSDPVAVADWGARPSQLALADSAIAWSEPDGVRISTGGGVMRVSEGSSGPLALTAAGDGPVAAWSDSSGLRVWAAGSARRVEGAYAVTGGGIALTPALLAWTGFRDGSRHLQWSIRGADGLYGPAWTSARAEQSPHGLVAAARPDGGTTLAWHAVDGEHRRIAVMDIAADGSSAGPEWVTPSSAWSVTPAVAVLPDGTTVLAYVRGRPTGRIRLATRPPGGAFDEGRPISGDGAALPHLLQAADGTLLLAYTESSGVRAAIRPPGGSFAAPEPVGDARAAGGPIAAAITSGGDSIIAWQEADGGGVTGELRVAARAAGGTWQAPALLRGSGVAGTPSAHGDTLAWIEQRESGGVPEQRLMTARLLDPDGGEDGRGDGDGDPPADREAPRLSIQRLALIGRRVVLRIAVDEPAELRVSGRRLRRAVRVRLASGTPRTVRLRVRGRPRRIRLRLVALDATGNRRVVRALARARGR